MKSVLRVIVKWLLLAPFAVLVVVFSISNLHGVTLSFWPFSQTLALPVFLLVLASLSLMLAGCPKDDKMMQNEEVRMELQG